MKIKEMDVAKYPGWIAWHNSRQMNDLSFHESPDNTGCNFSFQCNKLKKNSFSNKKDIASYSSFNCASFVTFVTAKVTIWQMHVK